MGGILLIIYNVNTDININIDFIKSFMNIKYRGTDDSSLLRLSTINLNDLNTDNRQRISYTLTKDQIQNYKQYNFILGYHRNSINDISFNASQPFEDPINTKLLTYKELRLRPLRKLICNGEIYNYKDLIDTNNFIDRDLSSNCDVEIILPIYIKYVLDTDSESGIIKTLSLLDGEFAFVLTENIDTFQIEKLNVFVCRDYLGIKPLYYVQSIDTSIIFFVSEIKAIPLSIIQNNSYIINHVPPGTYWSFQKNSFVNYYSLESFKDISNCTITSMQPDSLINIYNNIENLMTKSVVSRYKSESNIGILLSGGFDSCILSSILLKYLIENGTCINNLHIFTIGDSLGSDDIDINYSKEMIEFLELKYNIVINHHQININSIEILSSDISLIIYHLETFDPHTVRESIPYYYLMKYIKESKLDIKILLSGDGISELTCGCVETQELQELDDVLFQTKSVELLQNMYKFNLLRSDRISSIFGLEVRYPFLEKNLVEYILSIHPKLKGPGIYSNEKEPISKYIIRKSFTLKEEMIPSSILWREHSNITNSLTNFKLRLTNYINDNLMTDELFSTSFNILLNESEFKLPKNKEEMYYRLIFRSYYPSRDNLNQL